ncbi:hypothetical protein ACOSP7_019436 [Xanthoceras sorbifolium]
MATDWFLLLLEESFARIESKIHLQQRDRWCWRIRIWWFGAVVVLDVGAAGATAVFVRPAAAGGALLLISGGCRRMDLLGLLLAETGQLGFRQVECVGSVFGVAWLNFFGSVFWWLSRLGAQFAWAQLLWKS